MAFSETTKLEVRRKANFRCCRCQQVGVEVHHIMPKKDFGTDDIDNAAPLCPTCHKYFGNDPEQRKEIKQMRDHWYEIAKTQFSQSLKVTVNINELVLKTQKHPESVEDLKVELRQYMHGIIDSIKPDNSTSATSTLFSLPLGPIGFLANKGDIESKE